MALAPNPSIATLSVHEKGYRNLAYSLQKLDMRERARVATAEAQYPRNFPNASLHPRRHAPSHVAGWRQRRLQELSVQCAS